MKHILTSIVIFLIATFCTPLLCGAESSSTDKIQFTENNPNEPKEKEFLSPDAAFKLDLTAKNANNLTANFTIVPGYYLYKQRVKFVIKDASTGTIEATELPQAEIKEDKNFGKQEVYHHDFKVIIKIASANNPIVQATYQGCSEKGLCYAPQNKTFNIDLVSTSPSTTKSEVSGSITNDDDKTTGALKSGNLWLVIAGFFVAGLLLSLTPCVLPMIPILSSIIVGSQSKQAQNNKTGSSKMHAFGLSVAYVLGMALSYTLAGIVAGLSGNLLSQSLQSPLVLGLTALLFVILAFSMFGFYELKLPSAFESKLLNASNKLKGGEFLGVFSMGILSALIVSPCVAAPLAGALIYIGQTHNVLLGGIGLFALAIGMGVPLLLIGASAGSLLPKTGGWMTAVRNLFGMLMLAMAVYIAWPVLPVSLTTPLLNLFGISAKPTLPFTRVKSVAELDAAIHSANGKTVMLDFYADWCTSCKEMEKLTFSDNKVKAALAGTVLLQADVTANNEDDKTLLKRFGLFGPPGIIFFDKTGNEVKTRVIGYKNADDFIAILNKIEQ